LAYVSPTITPSGTTFAQLQAGGFRGQMIRLANTNAFPPPIRSLMFRLDALQTGIVQTVDAFLQGDPIATTDVNARLLAYATALKAMLAALEEINVLVNNNPGTLKTIVGGGGVGQKQRRVFP
jgi:hypothetical protein